MARLPGRDEEILKMLGSLLIQGGEVKAELKFIREFQRAHEDLDNKRFLEIREDFGRLERHWDPKVETLAKSDAEITARLSAMSEADATRRTLSIAAKAKKHQWTYGFVMCVIGAIVTILVKFLTS